MARDQMIEEPTIVHPLLRIVDENPKLTIDQRSVIAGFGVDVLVNHGTEDKALFEDAITLVVDFLLRVSANPKLIEPQSRVHVHVADALAVMGGDLDAADGYRGSMKKTLKALSAFAAQAEAADDDVAPRAGRRARVPAASCSGASRSPRPDRPRECRPRAGWGTARPASPAPRDRSDR